MNARSDTGIALSRFPSSLADDAITSSRVVGGRPAGPVACVFGGLIGVVQDADGALAAEPGWGVRGPEPQMRALCALFPPLPEATPRSPIRDMGFETPAELIALDEYADLLEGRKIGYTAHFQFRRGVGDRLHFLVSVGTPHPLPADGAVAGPPDIHEPELRVIASDVTDLFDHILETDGHYYFDAPDFISPTALSDKADI